MVRLFKMFPVMVMVLVLSSVVYAQTFFIPEKGSLRDLKGVAVVVEFLQLDIEKDGLNKSSIQTDVELKLRMAGIKVLTDEKWEKEPGRPILYVRVSIYKKEKMGFYVYNIDVNLRQFVFLSREVKIMCLSTTWNATGVFGLVDVSNVNAIRDSVKDKVDQFINDYLEMNPKE